MMRIIPNIPLRATLRRGFTGAVCVILAGACASKTSDDGPGAAGDAITVVSGFYPLFEVAGALGGDEVRALNLTPAGAEPHDLELNPEEVQRILDADLVLYLGSGFQPALEKVVRQRKKRSIDLLEGMSLRPGEESGHEEEGEEHQGEAQARALDPHVWLDPVLMSDIVDRVEAALAKVAPGDAQTFARNAADVRTRLDELHRQFTAGLANCTRKVLVTSHAAFGYLAARYGLRQQAIAGVSPEAEPTPERLQELAELVRSQGITTIFTETLVSPRTSAALAREAHVKTAVLNPVEGLSEEEIRAGKTYAAAMRENLSVLRTALGCS